MPKELSDRGIWWQVAGFTIVFLSSLAVLVEFEGADARAYRYLETAIKGPYWALAISLAGLFEGVRRMFEKASEIRAAYREKLVAKTMAKGRKAGIAEHSDLLREAYRRFGVEQDGAMTLPLTPEVEQFLFGSNNSDKPPYY